MELSYWFRVLLADYLDFDNVDLMRSLADNH